MRRSLGFTLIELLAAVAIFGLLAAMLFQMVRGALDVWRLGEERRESLEKGSALLEEIAADLRMIAAEQPVGAAEAPVRLVLDRAAYDFDLDGVEESVLARLRFVRACPEERFDARLRHAGEVPGASGTSDDIGGAATGAAARAPGGLAEMAFFASKPPVKGEDPARLTLYRAFRAPIGPGGDASLFADGALDRPEVAAARGVALADGVLYFGITLWARDTVGFDEPADTPSGPLSTWDSTRALLAPDGLSAFLLAKGPESLALAGDDVFPRRARVTLVLERDEDEAERVTLAQETGASGEFVRVSTARPFERESGPKFLKVGGEWMRWADVRGTELRVVRGERHTAPAPHPAGARIHLGATFERCVEIPVWREDWNDP